MDLDWIINYATKVDFRDNRWTSFEKLLWSVALNLEAATQGIEERGSLSPFLSQSGTLWSISESTIFGAPSLLFHFDGRLTANNDDECMAIATYAWGAALGANLLSIRGYSRASGALQVVQWPAWQDSYHRRFQTSLRGHVISLRARHRLERNSKSWLLSKSSGFWFMAPTSNAVPFVYSRLFKLTQWLYINLTNTWLALINGSLYTQPQLLI